MKELRIPKGPSEGRRKGTITIDADTAFIIRKIASSEGRSKDLSALVDEMISAYLAKAHPDWAMVGAPKTKRVSP